MDNMKEVFGEVISTYTRKEAEEDGVLVDISDTAEAKDAGFKVPICLTQAVHGLIKVPEHLKGYQDYKGRLWDVCWMASIVVKREIKKEDPEELIKFSVLIRNEKEKLKKHEMWIVFSKVEGFTVMLPEEY